MNGFYPDFFLRLIDELDIETMLSMRLSCKELKSCVERITTLKIEQTSSFINDLEEFRGKYKMLKRVMPKLNSMKIAVSVNNRNVISSRVSFRFPSRPKSEDFNSYHRVVKLHFLCLFCWLKDVDVKIDCMLTLTDDSDTIPSTMLVNYLLFELRSNFIVNKFRKYVEDDLHTCFKIKDGVLTLSKEFPITSEHGCIYEDLKQSIHSARSPCLDCLPWETITGVKIKCHPDSQPRVSVVKSSSRKPSDFIPGVYVRYEKLLPKIKGLPLTTNKGYMLKYV